MGCRPSSVRSRMARRRCPRATAPSVLRQNPRPSGAAPVRGGGPAQGPPASPPAAPEQPPVAPGPQTSPPPRRGFRIGPLYVTPTIRIGAIGLDTNVFYTATDRRTDLTANGGPG